MRLTHLLVAGMLLATATPGVAAETQDVVWEVTGCDETVAVLDHAGADPALLVVLAYRCSDATIGETRVSDFAVSEIALLQPDGTSRLLRQVTDSKALHDRLRRIGLMDSLMGTIDYSPGGPGAAPEVHVSFRGGSYTLSPTGVAGIPPTPSRGGASYTYEGKKGTIKLTYENHNQSASPAGVTIAASGDPALSRWIGADEATGPGLVAAGDWTGRAAIIE